MIPLCFVHDADGELGFTHSMHSLWVFRRLQKSREGENDLNLFDRKVDLTLPIEPCFKI